MPVRDARRGGGRGIGRFFDKGNFSPRGFAHQMSIFAKGGPNEAKSIFDPGEFVEDMSIFTRGGPNEAVSIFDPGGFVDQLGVLDRPPSKRRFRTLAQENRWFRSPIDRPPIRVR